MRCKNNTQQINLIENHEITYNLIIKSLFYQLPLKIKVNLTINKKDKNEKQTISDKRTVWFISYR